MRVNRIVEIVAVPALLALAACDSIVEVKNPNVIEAEGIDPLADQTTFARSALQNFYTVYPALIVYSGWQTNESRVGDTFPTRNEYGRQIVSDANGTHNGEIWVPLSRAVASSEDVLDMLKDVPDKDKNINIVRAAFSSAWSLQFMAETFCQGVMRVSAPLTPTQVLDSAANRFQRVITVGTANGSAEATSFVNAARVGLARAYLQQGKKPQAAAEAAKVPANFVFNVAYIDDASNRGRLGNGVFGFSAGGGRESLVVGPEWRAHAAAGDQRISFIDAGRDAQDGELRMFSQRKYGSYGAGIRLASKLEAQYIEAEAGTTAQQLALINARRAANGQAAFAGTDAAEVLRELMLQRGLDFWLEGKRMGDVVRNGAAVPYQLAPGNTYYKPALGEVASQKCWPVTIQEKDNNPNWK